MGLYQRGQRWWIDCNWRGIPRLQLSTWTENKTFARAMLRTLEALRDAGRTDILGLVAQGRLKLPEVHQKWIQNRDSLDHAAKQAESPELGPLVDEWLAWLKSPAAISPRTHRPFAKGTVHRYWESWQGFFRVLEKGRSARLADLNQSFCSFYRTERMKEGKLGATVNRDMVALGSFWRWCEVECRLSIQRFTLPRQEEAQGRDRWLDADEIAALQGVTPTEWWALYATLIYTGLSISEALGLRWQQDLHLGQKVIHVREYPGHRLKCRSRARDVPIPGPLAEVLAVHSEQFPVALRERFFTGALADYRRAYRMFRRLTKKAKLADVRIHDLRHTFGVHCVQSGVPLPRLQRLLGHSTVAMTMRYANHSPESYFEEDAARVAASMAGKGRDQSGPDKTILKLA